ncbi:MAG: hypothetical protein H7Z38_11950 [Rubrivivax sp.]|nr:hypothetical protein [Pyrinomonadaceae bacterium]
MLLTFTLGLAQAEVRIPAYFPWVAVGLLGVGGLGWLIAAVMGFARARAFGESPRWFAISAVCLLLNQIQWFVFAVYGLNERNTGSLLAMGAFFNLFVALGAICAIIGFMRLSNPKP